MFKQNLQLTAQNPFKTLSFHKHPNWTHTLTIEPKTSFLAIPPLDVYLLLKSYVEHESIPVDSIFLELSEDNQEKKIIKHIPVRTIKKITSYEDFKDWWDTAILKNWKYETTNTRICILLTLNEINIKKFFKTQSEHTHNIKPTYPWKKELLQGVGEELDLKKKLKRLIKDSHNYRDGRD